MKNKNNAPIDFVMIWVDGNDPEWRREKSLYDGKTVTASNSEVRFRDWDNLQYWFRGVEKFAPWVNKIHFVTWGHLPPWLDTSNPKINVVKHSDYIPAEYLPTFSSHTIELNLHRIEGLSEQFVYFNDDMFFTAPTKPEDFFKDGKPCDTAAMDCIFFGKDSAGPFNGSDITVINSHFKKKRVLKENFFKWYNPKNGIRNVIKSMLLYPWPWFPGMYYQHACNSFLKSTFETVWDKEFEALDETCSHRFRKSGDLNQWVMKFWQLAEGSFEVRPESFAYCYHVKESNFEKLLWDIPSGRRKILCINDTARTKYFEEKKRRLIEVFEECFPTVSEFEKAEYYKNREEPEHIIPNPAEEVKKALAFRLYEGIDFMENTIKFTEQAAGGRLSYSRKLFTVLKLTELLKIEESPFELIDEADAARFLKLLKVTVGLVSAVTIARSDISHYYKLMLLKLKFMSEPTLTFKDGDALIGYDGIYQKSLTEDQLGLQRIKIEDGSVIIEGCFSGYSSLPDDLTVTALFGGEYTECEQLKKDGMRACLGTALQKKFGFRVKIPAERIKNGKVTFILKAEGKEVSFKNFNLGRTTPLSNALTRSYYVRDGVKVCSVGDGISVCRVGLRGRLISEAGFLCQILRHNKNGGKKAVLVRLALPIWRLFVKKPIWVIEAGEKPDEGVAFDFFKYVAQNRQEVDVRLVVPEHYRDDGTISAVGKILNRETRKYKKSVLLASDVILEYPYERLYNPFRRRYGFYKDILAKVNILEINEDWENIMTEDFEKLCQIYIDKLNGEDDE